MRKLVDIWIQAEKEQYGLNQTQALYRLEHSIGKRVRHSRLSEWRRGIYCPSQIVISEMLYRSMPWILKKAGLEPTAIQQKRIDELLWIHEGDLVHLL